MALLSVAEALFRVTDGIEPLAAMRVPLAKACARVLAEDLPARLRVRVLLLGVPAHEAAQ